MVTLCYDAVIINRRIEYGTPVGREMEKLLKIPISNYNDVLTVLALPNFAPLLAMGWMDSLVEFI